MNIIQGPRSSSVIQTTESSIILKDNVFNSPVSTVPAVGQGGGSDEVRALYTYGTATRNVKYRLIWNK